MCSARAFSRTCATSSRANKHRRSQTERSGRTRQCGPARFFVPETERRRAVFRFWREAGYAGAACTPGGREILVTVYKQRREMLWHSLKMSQIIDIYAEEDVNYS